MACWYQKTMDFVGNRPIRSAFVSTNSLFQGEQARSMGPLLASRHFVIDFAHSTFAWTSEARGKAHVHCVIVGFSPSGTSTRKRLFTYASLLSEPEESTPRDISIFLTAGHAVVPEKRYEPLVAGVPTAYKGSQPTDGGYLIVSSDELGTVQADPIAAKYLRLYVQAREMLQGGARHCLWLAGAPAQDLRTSPVLRERLQLVAQWRRTISKTASVQESAVTPALFTQDRQPNTRYLAMPEVSSSTRRFIPGRFFDSDVIAGNKLIILPGASEWMFALLHSSMWNAWMRTVSGRLKSDFSFSPGIGYYTFPFPDLDDKAKSALTDAAAKVLAARDAHPDATLADLYDPIAMPSDLVAAHGELDRAVDRLYSPRKKFTSDTLDEGKAPVPNKECPSGFQRTHRRGVHRPLVLHPKRALVEKNTVVTHADARLWSRPRSEKAEHRLRVTHPHRQDGCSGGEQPGLRLGLPKARHYLSRQDHSHPCRPGTFKGLDNACSSNLVLLDDGPELFDDACHRKGHLSPHRVPDVADEVDE